MRILIVGGGIAGLAVARALALREIAADVIERDPTWRVAGAGIFLPGNGMAALRRLGLADDVLAAGSIVGWRRLLDERGRSLLDFDEAGLWQAVAPPVALHRRDLHEILATGPVGAAVRFGTTVGALVEGADGVQVTRRDGATETYDVVVGADGLESSIRELTRGPRPRFVGQVGWRFVLDGHPEISGWNGWMGPDRGFLALAIGAGRVYCYADVRSTDMADPTGGDRAGVADLFARFSPPVPSLVAEMPAQPDVWFGPVQEVAPPAWSDGRVVLVGDAAHASAPNMAEGASMALEDALVLAEVLGDAAAAGGPVPDALARFRQRRAPRVGRVQATTHRRDRIRYLPALPRRALLYLVGARTFRAHYRHLLTPP